MDSRNNGHSYFWGIACLWLVLAQLFLAKRVQSSVLLRIVFIAAAINYTNFERFVILVTSLHRDHTRESSEYITSFFIRWLFALVIFLVIMYIVYATRTIINRRQNS
jgi:glucan phosphoethanolaminetransferase (alkaline phosphatase superfamily)